MKTPSIHLTTIAATTLATVLVVGCGTTSVPTDTVQATALQNAGLADYEILPFSQSFQQVGSETGVLYQAWRIDRKKKIIQRCSVYLRLDRDDAVRPACQTAFSASELQNQFAASLHEYLAPSAINQAGAGVWLINVSSGDVTFCSLSVGPGHPSCYSEK